MDEKLLNENELENINGGFDYEGFGREYLQSLNNYYETITPEHIELAKAIQSEDWVTVQMKIINLATKDENILKLMLKYR